MEIKIKSKLEEHILAYLTPEGDVLDLEGGGIVKILQQMDVIFLS